MKFFTPIAIILLGLLAKFTDVTLTTPPATAAQLPNLKFLGIATIPTGTQFKQTEVGGLSGITYDPRKNVYYSISDDRSSKSPARYYTLKINLNQDNIKIDLVNVTTLLQPNGKPFPPLSLDPEGIALTRNNRLFISSEGDAERLIKPFIISFSLSGKQLQILPIPQKLFPSAKKQQGIRNNLSLESLTITPNQKYLFTATENALYQDGQAATVKAGSPCRILKYNLVTGQPEQEFLYLTDAVAGSPNTPTRFSSNGLADLLAIDSNHLLSLERSFSPSKGNVIKLYDVSVQKADNIRKLKSIKAIKINKIRPVSKKLLFDFSKLDIPLDNIEGLTFGSCLPDGSRSLIFVSDNNFTSLQVTQILAFSFKSGQKICSKPG